MSLFRLICTFLELYIGHQIASQVALTPNQCVTSTFYPLMELSYHHPQLQLTSVIYHNNHHNMWHCEQN